MFKVKKLVWVMGCVSVMGGCALYPGKDKQAVDIKPVMNVKHATDSPAAMYSLGRYYQGKASYTEAIAAYEKTLAMAPGHVEAHNGLGVSHSMQGRHELALQHLRKAIELSPMATHLHNNLGYVHLVLGQESEAATAFEQALRLDPENRKARNSLAAVYERVGLHDKAAMLTMVSPAPAPASISANTAHVVTIATPSSTIRATVAATIVASATVGKQEIQHSTRPETRLVQISPNVFEFRMTEADSMMAILTGKPAGKIITPQNSTDLGGKNACIEVSNGNGVTGLAKQVSGFLQENGFAKARLTDRLPFQQLQTEIHYRPGNYALANQINRMLPKPTKMVEESYDLRRGIQVRVLLGKDVAHETAYFDSRSKIQIAQSTGNSTLKE